MVEVAWAAVGLLAVAVFGMFGMFFYLGSKIDHTNGRIDALGARLDARMDQFGARLDDHIERHTG